VRAHPPTIAGGHPEVNKLAFSGRYGGAPGQPATQARSSAARRPSGAPAR
jgi:hypothetical protein